MQHNLTYPGFEEFDNFYIKLYNDYKKEIQDSVDIDNLEMVYFQCLISYRFCKICVKNNDYYREIDSIKRQINEYEERILSYIKCRRRIFEDDGIIFMNNLKINICLFFLYKIHDDFNTNLKPSKKKLF